MGWLGWTEKEAFETNVNSIILAMEGKLEMMYPESIKATTKPRGSWGDSFKSFANAHNLRISRHAR